MVILAALLLLWQTHQRLGSQTLRYTTLLSHHLAAGLQPLLLDKNTFAVQQAIKAMVDGDTVIGIRVTTPDGQPVAEAGNTVDRALVVDDTIEFENNPIAHLQVRAHPALASLPWFPELLLLAAAAGLVTLCSAGFRALREEPAPAIAAPEPKAGLQWPACLESTSPQTVLCVGIANYSSLTQSLGTAMLSRHVRETLELLKGALGKDSVPVLPLAPGRFILVFGDLRDAIRTVERISARLPELNPARKAQGLLALRLQTGLLREPEGSDSAGSEQRWLDLQQHTLTLLALAGLSEENETVIDLATGEQVQALLPKLPLKPIAGETGQPQGWRWQSVAPAAAQPA